MPSASRGRIRSRSCERLCSTRARPCCGRSSPESGSSSTFELYSHDMTRQIETHHYVARLHQDFLQFAVYDSDDSSGGLIDRSGVGVEYAVSDGIFVALPAEEQKLWHSQAY
ncbi:hypothetical protein MLD38_018625 [Melastoma candidum]|uniref:Uncharacterized protein n=1 Tax=Melastoma candidum TaxID=119954 RepID=A0ACB9QUC3_9MYRT|nr:hypothetical protein MLD38_018625 [Melastoma candidum]